MANNNNNKLRDNSIEPLKFSGLPFEHPIERWKSKIEVSSPKFRENYDAMAKSVEELNMHIHQLLNQEEEKEEIVRAKKKGLKTARERISLVLDEDSPFLEICPLAGNGIEGMTLGGSTVAGIGLVCGVECMITSSVYTLKGGSVNESGLLKGGRIAEIVFENRLPLITLIQSAGANLPQQFKVFHAGGGGFRGQAKRSKEGIPQITLVFGNCTAGGAYTPGMSDYVIMVKNQGKSFLGGPPLVKMATHEVVDEETLGGAEMHSRVSGVSDFLAINEIDAIRLARETMANCNWQKLTPLPRDYFNAVEEPFYDPDEILGIVSPKLSEAYDVREVIARVVDGSRFSEFKPLYGSTLVTCFAKVHGIPVGILANNGVLFTESANKGTQFIQLCNQASIPLIYLHNITGFMVGQKYEQEGIIKAGSRMINAVSNSTVPAISIMLGASYGAGNYAMSGRAYHPRFLFSWPISRCSVMGGEQLSGVMDIVARDNRLRKKLPITEEWETQQDQRKKFLATMVDQQADVYYTSARCLDDAIIDPRETRTVLGFSLSVVYGNEVKGGNLYGVSRM